MKYKILDFPSMAAVFASLGTALTLERVGVAIGIASGVVTLALNVFYMLRKDAREQRQAELAIREAEERLAASGGAVKRAAIESSSKL